MSRYESSDVSCQCLHSYFMLHSNFTQFPTCNISRWNRIWRELELKYKHDTEALSFNFAVEGLVGNLGTVSMANIYGDAHGNTNIM